MPVKVTLKTGNFSLIYPSNDWKSIKIDASVGMDDFKTEPNFYVNTKKKEGI
jgi:hypothetical protein